MAATAPRTDQVPPPHIVFGDQVAMIPSISDFFDRPLWVQNPNTLHFQSRPHVNHGAWINAGDVIMNFVIRRNAHRSFWRDVADIREPIIAGIKTPVSGLVLDSADAFSGRSWIDAKTGLYAQNFMLAVLLPTGAAAPGTCEHAFKEFCDVCSTYREPLFRNRNLIAEQGGSEEAIWSNQEIDEVLDKIRTAPILVRPVSDFGTDVAVYTEHIEMFKRKHPANFPSETHAPSFSQASSSSARAGRSLHEVMERLFNPMHGSVSDRPFRSRAYMLWLKVETAAASQDPEKAFIMAVAESDFTAEERRMILAELMQGMNP